MVASAWFLLLVASVLSQDIRSPCQSTPNIPACYLSTLCQTQQCATFTTLSVYCSDKDARNSSVCTPPVAKATDVGIINSTLAIQEANSICYEMPMMSGCSKCAFPVTNSQNCNVLQAYSHLCLEMGGMSQCSSWKSFCANNTDVAKTAICTSNPTITGTSSNTQNGQKSSSVLMAPIAAFMVLSVVLV